MKKVLKEWSIPAPWGQIALISWGNPAGAPVLLVHGREDSAATFIPLLELLPDTYHYVGFDLPGHGKSDPFPPGLMLYRFHFVTAVEVVIRHLGWKRFIYLAHSMGAEIGFFYNSIHPGEIIKNIYLDVVPAFISIQNRPIPEYYKTFFATYFESYSKSNKNEKVFTKRRVLDAVMKARELTEEQAELILSRSLKRVGEDQYKLSWDRRLKYMAILNSTYEFYQELFSKNMPPTLFLRATVINKRYNLTDLPAALDFAANLEGKVKNFYSKAFEGGHDMHFTHPGLIARDVSWFLEKDYGVKSKL